MLSTEINNGAKRKCQLMQEDYITLPFSLDKPINFGLGTYVDIDAGLFEVIDLQKPTYNNTTGGYDYQLRLDAYYWKWKNKIFKFTPEVGGQEASWSLTASLDVHLDIFLKNLKALGYTYRGSEFEFSIDATVENKAMSMTYSNMNMIDALSAMAESWECEWWITDNIIHFGRCEYGTSVDFEIGVNVAEMTSSASQDTYATRLYVFGSDKNLPSDYRPIDENVVVNGVVQKRLMLPVGTPYIDAYEWMSEEEAIEDVVVFDEIFPKFDGNVSAVITYDSSVENEDGTTTTETFYRFQDDGILFSKDYILEGQELRAKFTSGQLNGMEFGLVFNPKNLPEKFNNGDIITEAQLYEVVANEDYGRKLPDATLHPQVGDSYVLIGWDSTKIADLGLVDKAEKELLAKGQELLAKRKIDPNTYNCKMFSDYMYGLDEEGNQDNRFAKHFDIGDKVKLINSAYFNDGRESRIIGYEYNLDYPFDNPVYTVGETASYSRLGELESKIDALTYKGQTYTGAGGSGVYVIGTNDTTRPTNRNVFSALRSDMNFLSKLKDDRSKGKIATDKAVEVGDFKEGTLGSGAAIYEKNGSTYTETDYLKVRKKATFTNITVQELKHVGGEILLSPAAIVCTRVEDTDEGYRCFFDTTDADGRKVYSMFEVGDQARCQTFNEGARNRYYFRLVTDVDDGEGFITLSKTDFEEGSDIPMAGDTIVQLGNRTDTERQAAIIQSAYGADAPSYKQYRGINGFSLEGKQVTRLSPYGNELTGKLTLESGSKGWKNLEGLQDGINDAVKNETEKLEYGKNNLLLNSGFTGDFVTASLSGESNLDGESQMFSPSLKYWRYGDVVIQKSEVSESGMEAYMFDGSHLEQPLLSVVIPNDSYVFSFRGKGGKLRLIFGEEVCLFDLGEEWNTYVRKFQASEGARLFRLGAVGDCTICELQLERGTIRSAWGMSPLDNRSELAKYESLTHVKNLLKAQTTVDGGIVNTGLITMGKLDESNELVGNTAGISGQYTDDDSLAYWAGGDYQQALFTISTYLDNPNYAPTDEELRNMAKFVVTHGGRAILNDIILRGYIYALGGYFKGKVDIAGGRILLNEDGSGQLANGNTHWTKEGITYKRAPEYIEWINISDFIVGDTLTFDKGCYIELAAHLDDWFFLPVDLEMPYTVRFRYTQASRSDYPAVLNGIFGVRKRGFDNLFEYTRLTAGESDYEFELTYNKASNRWEYLGDYDLVDDVVRVKSGESSSGGTSSVPTGISKTVSFLTNTERHILVFQDGILMEHTTELINNGN